MATTPIHQNPNGSWPPATTVKKDSGRIMLIPAPGITLNSAAPEAGVGLTNKGKGSGNNSRNINVDYDSSVGTATSGYIDVTYSEPDKGLTESSSRAMLTLNR